MFNLVVLQGRLTADPELKTTTSGKYVTSFAIANETGYGENKKTNFINVVAWQKTAEFVTKYFSKGSAIGIEGKINTRQYQDKNGNNRTLFEVVADEVHFIESKKNNDVDITADERPQYFENNSNDFTEIDGLDDLPF